LVRRNTNAKLQSCAGVEGVESVVEQFFSENHLSVTKSDISGIQVWPTKCHKPKDALQGHRYSTPDGRLTILACDLFDITPEVVGPVEAVWDRGSLVALGVDTRPRYVALMRGLLVEQNFRYLVHGRECEHTSGGPPHSLNTEQMHQLFRDWAAVEVRRRCLYPWQVLQCRWWGRRRKGTQSGPGGSRFVEMCRFV
jgi:thiopurine S-methyltransferase